LLRGIYVSIEKGSVMYKLAGALALVSMLGANTAIAANNESFLDATLAVTATIGPNTNNIAYCGGNPLSVIVEAHGVGFSSTFGPLSVVLQKTLDLPGAMHGCLDLTSPNGDVLHLIYDGTEPPPNANGFITAPITLTVIDGKGKFRGFKGLSTPASAVFTLLGTEGTQVSAYYMVK
jgi:hypothetical protein